jgi:aminodeoxyfutalosine deaminase
MSIQKFTADWVCPVSSAPLKNGVVITDSNGKILAIEPRAAHDVATLKTLKGVLVPGFVNAHCHLELSHMKGLVATGTTLIPFITGVVTRREASIERIADAIEKAEKEMLQGGIVAVGDISNQTDTLAQKAKGNLHYYTFIEMFDFMQAHETDAAFTRYQAVYDSITETARHKKAVVPHAPYSVSENLFEKLKAFSPASGATISIHNQETQAESDLFERGNGGFFDFYGKFGVSLDGFKPSFKPSIYYALGQMNPNNRSLFVHNTLTQKSEIEAAQAWSPHVFWATCPNANLYIENRLPNYQLFLDTQARVCIGTDSLTSNWQLSVLEEMKTIQRYQSYVPFSHVLKWATLNGAQALGFDAEIGSLEVGKTPGLNLISSEAAAFSAENFSEFALTPDSKVQRIA